MAIINKFSNILCILLSLNHYVNGLDNGLALTPPMGWKIPEAFRCITDCQIYPNDCISESVYQNAAQKLVDDGFLAAGYQYVKLVDCWSSHERDSDYNLQADPGRFPSGIAALATYVHNRGLKLGIHADLSQFTCQGHQGSLFSMERDASTFAQWGVDSLFFDNCYMNMDIMNKGFPLMGQFLNKTGRPILYSCIWPAYVAPPNTPPYAQVAQTCNVWRVQHNIEDSWASVKSIINFYATDAGNFSTFAGPGHFSDPDILLIGDYSLSHDQEKAQMALWSIIAAPLIIAAKIDDLKSNQKDLLLNPRVIAVNQDQLGIQGRRVVQLPGNIELWLRPIAPSGSFAAVILNLSEGGSPASVTVKLSDFNIVSSQTFTVTEVFSGTVLGQFSTDDEVSFSVNPTAVAFVTAVPQ